MRRISRRRLLALEGAAGAALAALLFALLLALVYPEAVFQGKVFTSPDSVAPLGFAEYAAAHGEGDAAWNPFVFAGMPATASLSSNPGLYPPGIALRLAIDALRLPPLTWLLAHYLLAGLGLFLFLRERGVRGWVAWIASAWFLLLPTQVAIGAYGHGSKVMTLAWIPWVLLFTDRLIARRRVTVDAALLSFSLACLLLSAHVQVAYYGLLTAGLFALFRLLLVARRGSPRGAGLSLAIGVLAIALAALSAAPLYQPVHEYSRYSNRGVGEGGGADFEYATGWSLHPAEWSTFLFPSSWGFGETSYFGKMPMTNYPNFLGWLPLLAALALFLVGPRRRFDLFFAGLAIMATLVAAGRHLPLFYRAFYDYLPWFNRFRVPVMILLLQQLSVALLFARGLERALGDRACLARLRQLVFAGLAILLLGLLFGPGSVEQGGTKDLAAKYGPRLAQASPAQVAAFASGLAAQAADWYRSEAIRGLILLGLFAAALELLRRRGESLSWAAPLLVGVAGITLIADQLPLDRKVLHPGRHWSHMSGVELWGRPASPSSTLPPRTLDFLSERLGGQRFYALPGSRFVGNEAAASGLASLGGYHAAKMAVADSVVNAFSSLMRTNPSAGADLFGRFAVSYLVSGRQINAGPDFPSAFSAEEQVYENRAARPRLFLSENVVFEAAGESRVRLMDGRAEPGVVYADARFVTVAGDGEPGSLSQIEWGIETVGCRAELERPALLVLADMNYPGWRVSVDGQERPLIAADGFFRAVALAPGDEDVRFHFEPTLRGPLMLLRRLSLLGMGLLLIGGLLAGALRGNRSPMTREEAAA